MKNRLIILAGAVTLAFGLAACQSTHSDDGMNGGSSSYGSGAYGDQNMTPPANGSSYSNNANGMNGAMSGSSSNGMNGSSNSGMSGSSNNGMGGSSGYGTGAGAGSGAANGGGMNGGGMNSGGGGGGGMGAGR